ncbi:hypothetical protein CFIMG_002459RA [Ceratocystis fimbriata CBS 114723]|uniref:Uncharacterized protein n=1 Tax=Ceratocystis fimbriata CBS 114723 TaxID=1035309 RepID=A0A2C5WK91_9PEZI|nr:hypothetical protein CFIMG_002459RA [Ceratocystis fimbriata CBS 114723]
MAAHSELVRRVCGPICWWATCAQLCDLIEPISVFRGWDVIFESRINASQMQRETVLCRVWGQDPVERRD